MAKNKGKGGKTRRKGRKGLDEEPTELVFKEDGTEYGHVQRVNGNGRFQVYCADHITRLGVLRGSMRRKVWVITGDVVLYSIRDFQAEKVDIIHKYSNSDVTKLYRYGELSQHMYDVYVNEFSSPSSMPKDTAFIDFMDEHGTKMSSDEDNDGSDDIDIENI